MVRTRNSAGRFEKERYTDDIVIHTNIFPRGALIKGIISLLIFFLFSPWIFVLFKNNSLTNVTERVRDFYDDNFSCRNLESCDCRSERSEKRDSDSSSSNSDNNRFS